MKLNLKSLLPTLVTALVLATGCTDKETAIGVALQDPSTQYHGVRDTLYANTALSVRDDSLRTSGYEMGIIGHYADATFGSVRSTLYTQVALPNSTGITFDDNTVIDSVVLSLVTANYFPAKAAGYNLHFEVAQLAEPLLTDSIYYSTDSLQADPSKVFYSQRRHYTVTDSTLRMRMAPSFHSLLQGSHSTDDFMQAMKGLRIRVVEADSDPCMVRINWAATGTVMKVHYHYADNPADTMTYVLKVGTASHFTRFEHNYAGTALGADSLPGTNRLYMEPLGGYNIKLGFDEALRSFAASHPYATVHFAELLLPVAAEADTNRPAVVTLLQCLDDGSAVPTPDLLDGTYDPDRQCYRLRVTMHMQTMLRQGQDRGMLLYLDTRRQDARRTVVNGTADPDPIRIEFIYTE